MITNPKIKQVFTEISAESLKQANKVDPDKKYLKRLLSIYKDKLTEDEQIFMLKFLLDHVHFKSIITDPDNMLTLHNIKLRTYTYLFLLFSLFFFLISILFNSNSYINSLLINFTNIFKLLTSV